MRHEYQCNDCGNDNWGGRFTLPFEPRFDPPAFCPSCGEDKYVTYVGEVVTQPIEYLDAMQKIVENLSKARYSSGGYSLSDLDRWLENDFSKMADLIHDLRMSIEGGE